jgi:hypothetical protein
VQGWGGAAVLAGLVSQSCTGFFTFDLVRARVEQTQGVLQAGVSSCISLS